MRLSGWTRLWIVCALLIWGAGAWWLYNNPLPPIESAAPNPEDCEPSGPSTAQLEQMRRECLTQQANEYLANRANIEAENRERRTARLVSQTNRVVAVIAAPLLLAAAFLTLRALLRWIARGFRAPEPS